MKACACSHDIENICWNFREFKSGYLDLLRRQFGTKRVRANNVYQEYINDRDHVHMNSTQWETLTEFVKWLGREGWLWHLIIVLVRDNFIQLVTILGCQI